MSPVCFGLWREGLCVCLCYDLTSVNISQGLGCFNGFMASMLVGYLLATHKISKMMSAYQVLRNALHFLGKLDKTLSFSQEAEFRLSRLPDATWGLLGALGLNLRWDLCAREGGKEGWGFVLMVFPI